MFTLYDPVCKLENYRKSIMALLLAPYPFPRTLTSTNVPMISYLSNKNFKGVNRLVIVIYISSIATVFKSI